MEDTGKQKVRRDCYFCANAPVIDQGKPYCTIWCENIEPTFTGEGAYGGWSCEGVASKCGRFKPKRSEA